MAPRVGSALDFLAATIVALAVFVLPLVLWHGTSSPSGVLLACVLAAGAVVWLVHGPKWPSRLAALIGAGVVTFVGAIVAFLLAAWIMEKASICGWSLDWFEVGLYGAPVIYAAIGGWALKGRVGVRFFLGPPAGAVLGIAWVLVVVALTHHGHDCNFNIGT